MRDRESDGGGPVWNTHNCNDVPTALLPDVEQCLAVIREFQTSVILKLIVTFWGAF